MNKRFSLIIFFLITISSSYATVIKTSLKKQTGFVLNGTVTGFKDSTWIYLFDESQQKLFPNDSVLIINNKFQFKGHLTQKTVRALIAINHSPNFRLIWLENAIMSFKAEKGHFRNGIITGSKTQLEQDKLNVLVNPIKDAKDSIERLDAKETPKFKKENLLKQYELLVLKENAINTHFIETNPNSIVSASVLSVHAPDWGKAVVAPLYANFSIELKNTFFGKKIADFLLHNKDLKVGDHYANFEQQSASGKLVKLSDYTGKLTLLEFWASWCGPCRKDNPGLIKTYNQFKNKGFKILSVSADDKKADWLKAIEKDGLPWPQVCDLKGDQNDIILMYGVNKFPSNFLIDEKGIIIAQDLRGEDLNKKLAELLK